MDILKPAKLSILYSTVPENDAPPWNPATEYKPGTEEGNVPLVVYKHYVYLCVAANTGKPPDKNADYQDAPWRTYAVTNQYACIDSKNNTQTRALEGQDELIIEVPYNFQHMAVGLLNMDAVSVAVGIKDHAGPPDEFIWGGETKRTLLPAADWHEWFFGDFAYEEKSLRISLRAPAVDWWEWFFGDFEHKQDLVITTPQIDGVLWVSLKGSRPAIGTLLTGRVYTIGKTQFGVTPGFIDYSLITTDAFGNDTWIKRPTAKRAEFPIVLHPSELDRAHKLLQSLAGEPALWVGDDGTGYESLAIFGFAKDSGFPLVGPSKATLNLEVRGMI